MMNNDPTQYLQFDDEAELTPTQESNGPVTVLGRTFVDDEARREYFRNELRKKLPELRKIEGFPIGEDDDIIALSDPPYYTACPNPWLNDFISEWEEETSKLEAQGLRKKNFEVTVPYTSDVSEGKNNPIYMAHAYHTKVPHPAIMRYILHYTQPGDIVFDGFCGTGMTGVATNMCASVSESQVASKATSKIGVRHGICTDLAPAACHIAAGYNLPFDQASFSKRANEILDKVEEELGWMYETQHNGVKGFANYYIWSDVFSCPNCGRELNLWEETVSSDTKSIKSSFKCPSCGFDCTKKNMSKVWETFFDVILDTTIQRNKSVPVRVNFTVGGRRAETNISSYDIQVLQKIEAIDISKLHTSKLLDGGFNTRQPIESNGVTHTHQFYTKRNLIYLSQVYEFVREDPFLLLWFTSALQNTSRMYKFRTDRKGGILNGTLFIPSLNMELSPYAVLKRKITDISNMEYDTRGNTVVGISSATNLNLMHNDCIDYIFVDPPFGANIMYSELSSIWESWLKVKTDNTKEAIVNEAQNKTLFDYQALMNASLKEFYRVLKPGKWLTMEFSNTSAAVWNSIQNALQGVGFVVANVSALDKQQGSFKAVTTTTAVKQDLIISCFKPSDSLIQKFDALDFYGDDKNVYDGVHTFIDELLSHLPVTIVNEKKTTAVVERSPKILYDRLIAFFVQRGQPIPMDAGKFQHFLRDIFVERDGMLFTAEQALQYDELRRENPGTVTLALFVGSESEGIQWLKRELQDNPQTYQEIQPKWIKDLVSPKKGDTIPELLDILKENFLQDDEGRWYIPDAENEADLERVRQQRLLREFKGYADETAQRARVKIKEARLEALRAGFKNCYQNKDFETIVRVGDRIPQTLLTEDEILLQYYDIASSRI